MKQIIGKPLTSIPQRIIGKVTFSPIRRWKRKKFILVSYDNKIGPGYAAVIAINDNLSPPKTATISCNPENIKQLNNGDIIAIDTNGNIDLIYEKHSSHNFLLTTQHCNCSCIMCPNPVFAKKDNDPHSIFKVISLIDKDAQTLGITGGEPTLLDEQLIAIIRTCKKKLPTTALLLLTNGMKFEDFNYVQKIAAIQHPALTIDVALYSDTDTEHNYIIGANGFYKTIEGLYNLARFNQRIGIRIVIHKLNYKRLPQLAEFIYRNFPFVSHIAFMQMETSGIAKTNLDKLWIDPYDYNCELEQAVTHLNRRAMNVSIYNTTLCVLPKTLWQYARKSISTWKNIYIDECENCSCKESCAGFFASALDIHSSHIAAIVSDKTTNQQINSNEKYYASTKSYRKRIGEHWVYFSPNSSGFPIIVNDQTDRIFASFNNGATIKEAKEFCQQGSCPLNEHEFLASIALLIDRGFLKKNPESEIYQAAKLEDIGQNKSLTIWLHITNQCNLRCDYCFVTKSSQMMSEHTIERVVASIIKTTKKYNLQELKIRFAGGEPTLAMDKILVFHRALKDGLRDLEIKIDFGIISNGTIMHDKLLDFLQQEHYNIGISLDGHGITGHDIYRKFKDTNKGSWEIIEKNLQRLIERGISPFIMSTINELSCATLTELMIWVLEKGLRTRLSVISDCNAGCTNAKRVGMSQQQYIETYINAFEAMFTELEKEKYSFDVGQVMRICDLRFDSPAYTSCCSLTVHHLAISHEGKLTYCPMAINSATADLGDDLLVALRKTINFNTAARNNSQHQKCLACQWFPVCVGGCLHSNMQIYQSPFATPTLHDFYRYVIPRYIDFYGKKIVTTNQVNLKRPLKLTPGTKN